MTAAAPEHQDRRSSATSKQLQQTLAEATDSLGGTDDDAAEGTARCWLMAMQASSLTPAQKLVLTVATERMTGSLRIRFSVKALSRRLGMAPATLREHRDAACAAGWLVRLDGPRDRAAPGRAAAFRAQVVAGSVRRSGRQPGTVPVPPAPLDAVAPAPSTLDGAGSSCTVDQGKSGNGAGATGTVSLGPGEPGTSAGDSTQRPVPRTRPADAGGTSTPSRVRALPAVPGPRPAAQADPPARGASPQVGRRSRARTDSGGPVENPRRRAAQQRSIWPASVDPAEDASGSAGAASESHEQVGASGGDHQRVAEIRPSPPSALAVEAVAALDQLAHRAAAAGVEPGRLPGAAGAPPARQRPPWRAGTGAPVSDDEAMTAFRQDLVAAYARLAIRTKAREELREDLVAEVDAGRVEARARVDLLVDPATGEGRAAPESLRLGVFVAGQLWATLTPGRLFFTAEQVAELAAATAGQHGYGLPPVPDDLAGLGDAAGGRENGREDG